MSKFEYVNFYGGSEGTEFVCHAGKFDKEEALNICISENEWHFDEAQGFDKWRLPTDSDVQEAYVRYYVRPPDRCACDTDGGYYSYCEHGARGGFPVWVIRLDTLKEGND